MTRIGKIARLPAKVREELNTKLDDGQEGPALLDWLNALPEAQTSLKENFQGAPITKQNLSEWRLGGFREWQIRRELLDQALQLAEGADEMEKAVDTALLPGKLAAALAARYAALLNGWDGEPDEKFEAQLRILCGLNRDIALLQKTMHQAVQQKREMQKAEDQADRRENEELKNRTLNMIQSIPEREALAAALGGGQRGFNLAKMITAVKYDLPLEKDERPAAPVGPAESVSVLPSPAKSKRGKHHPARPSPVAPGTIEEDPIRPSPTEFNSNE